jgi:hypothetical protein
MLPKQHLFFGVIFASILFFIFPQIGLIEFFIIVASTVLIDIDHYTYYVYKKKDLDLKRAYNWFFKDSEKYSSLSREQKDKYYTGFCFLHGFEILIVLFLLGRSISAYFYYVLIGFAFHMVLDVIAQIKIGKRIDKLSIIYDFLKFKKLKLLQDDGRE